jgi:Spy/CpxP family protein refolding chaperone
MKTIRIVALGATLLAGRAMMVSAQSAGSVPQQGQPGTRGRGMQMNGIELTDAQKAKLEEIQRKYQPEMLALRDQMMNGGDRAELMKKGMALREKSGSEIRAILTPDQQVVWDKNVAEMKARMEQMQRQTPPTR